MKILFLNPYFLPENIAFTHLEQDLIQGILAKGHTIEVLCPVPTRGISAETAKKYKNRKQETMFDGKVTVTRFWAPQEGRNPLIRAFRYFWCNLRHYQLGKKQKGVDVVFAPSTPPTQGWIAGKVARKLHCPFVYNLQDIFPDSLVTTGLAKKDSLLWKIGRKVENATYKGANRIILISQAMKRNVLAKGLEEEKIEVVSNWVDTDAVQPVAKEENKLFEEFGIDRSKFTVVYAGNFGAAQGAGVVLEAAKQLPEVQFVIYGGGAEFSAAREKAESMPNVIINGLLPQNRVPEVYSLGDVALITCKKGVGNSGLPSKTWSIMACGTPIVAAFDTDSVLAEILQESKAGICVEPEDPEALAKAIRQMVENTAAYTGGRDYVNQNASRDLCVEKYIQVLENPIKDSKDRRYTNVM